MRGREGGGKGERNLYDFASEATGESRDHNCNPIFFQCSLPKRKFLNHLYLYWFNKPS